MISKETFFQEVKDYCNKFSYAFYEEDLKCIWWIVTNVHEGQIRRNSGEPFLTHLIEVARNVMKYSDAEPSMYPIFLALCHDLLEDTDIPHYVIVSLDSENKLFWDVHDLTKRKDDMPWQYYNRIQTYYARLIKGCDRLHNIQDLELWEPKKATAYIDETRKYVIPLVSDSFTRLAAEIENVLRKKECLIFGI